MATITKTVTENRMSTYKSTWVFTYTGTNQVINSSTFVLGAPSVTAKFTYSGKNYAFSGLSVYLYVGGYGGSNNNFITYFRGAKEEPSPGIYYLNPIPTTSGTAYNVALEEDRKLVRATSGIFNSSNPTVRTLDVYLTTSINASSYKIVGGVDQGQANGYTGSGFEQVGVVYTVTLDAPPTFVTATQTVGPYYQNATQYTVNVSSLSAKYGGTISEVKLTIGSQSVTRTDNGTLTITPQNVGTYTPTVTVTDSRGQVTTQTLDSITVLANTVGISNLSAQRINANDLLDDEGTNAIVMLDANYTAFSGNYLLKPTVTINGTATSNVTWYETWDNTNGFSDAVNWTNYAPSSPKTLYGKVTDTFTDSLSYQIGVSASTTYAQSSTITTTLAQAFYLLVGKAGGKGLGIGMKPTTDALHIGMPQINHDDVSINGNETVNGDETVNGKVSVNGGGVNAVELQNDSDDVMYSAKRTDTNTEVRLGVGIGGTNHGVFSANLNRWMIYSDGTKTYIPEKVVVEGNGPDVIAVRGGSSSQDIMQRVTRTDTGKTICFGVGASGVAGVYDSTRAKWILHSDTANTYLDGHKVNAQNILSASKSNTVASNAYYNGAAITIPANSRYLIIAWIWSSTSNTTYPLGLNLIQSGASAFYSHGIKAPMNGGGGGCNTAYISTGSSAVTVTAQHYGYLTTSHTESTMIVGIPVSSTTLL